MVLLVDNYDSFTYNLAQYLEELGAEVEVRRNDRITATEVEGMRPQRIVISPGPGRPEEAGISPRLIERFAGSMPILGVCLGHQAIATAFGGRIVGAREIRHGKVSEVTHDGKGCFNGIASPLTAMRYHSLAVEQESLPDCLEVSAWSEDGMIMGLRHREMALEGVQFHPESILTPTGKQLLGNFLRWQP